MARPQVRRTKTWSQDLHSEWYYRGQGALIAFPAGMLAGAILLTLAINLFFGH